MLATQGVTVVVAIISSGNIEEKHVTETFRSIASVGVQQDRNDNIFQGH